MTSLDRVTNDLKSKTKRSTATNQEAEESTSKTTKANTKNDQAQKAKATTTTLNHDRCRAYRFAFDAGANAHIRRSISGRAVSAEA